MIVLFPVVKVFAFITGLLMPSSRLRMGPASRHLNEDEIRIALLSGSRGLSALRRKMISGALDIGARPVKEIIVPRPQVRAIDIDASLETVVRTIQSAGFSRYPVVRGRLDNIEGLVRTKDIVTYVFDNKELNIRAILRKPLFVPELASLENVLLQMQAAAVHMAFVVDEFGNMEGIVTVEDIIEEIVGDIQDEREAKPEDIVAPLEDGVYLVKGSAPVKEINARLALEIPEKSDYTTLAGFFLNEFGRIPREHDALEFAGCRLTVEKMIKRHINQIRIDLCPGKSGSPP
jgi:putative hemolysin